MGSKLIAYAQDFASFLLEKTNFRPQIRAIILFGSVAREEAGKESDVDIFIDLIKENKVAEKEFAEINNRFLKSTKYKNYWQPQAIENPIKITSGILDQWKELHPSLIANGLILFGKYMPITKRGRHIALFTWENIKPNAKRVLFNKQVFGYRQNKKLYEGRLQKFNGERLGKGCITIPLEHSTFFLKLFRKFKITVKIKKVMEYS